MERIVINKKDYLKWWQPNSDYYLSFESGIEDNDSVFEKVYPFIQESCFLTLREIEVDFYCGGFYSYERVIEECNGYNCYAPIMWEFVPHPDDEEKMIIIRYGRDM